MGNPPPGVENEVISSLVVAMGRAAQGWRKDAARHGMVGQGEPGRTPRLVPRKLGLRWREGAMNRGYERPPSPLSHSYVYNIYYFCNFRSKS